MVWCELSVLTWSLRISLLQRTDKSKFPTLHSFPSHMSIWIWIVGWASALSFGAKHQYIGLVRVQSVIVCWYCTLALIRESWLVWPDTTYAKYPASTDFGTDRLPYNWMRSAGMDRPMHLWLEIIYLQHQQSYCHIDLHPAIHLAYCR